MGGGYPAGRKSPQQNRRKQQRGSDNRGWLLNVCVTAFAAGALVAFGHWFSSTPGRRLGGDKKKSFPKEEGNNTVQNEESKRRRNQTHPKSLEELRLRRLQAAEARLQSPRTQPCAARLTPLGMILELTQKVDKLGEEANSLLAKVSSSVMNPLEEQAQMQLLEHLDLLQLEIDAIQGDEIVWPHRKSQTDRIQTLVAKLNQLKHSENSTAPVFTEVGSPQT